MSTEVITTISTAAGLMLTLAGGFAWMIHRIDNVQAEVTAMRVAKTQPATHDAEP